ncbi:MAG: hypothetical protein H7Y09_01050 [Chitinophagaceae bacterium]|nr:hypothetical protein [Anaerolineae bacterium]
MGKGGTATYQLSPQEAALMAEYSISLATYAVYNVMFEIIQASVFVIVSLILFLRCSEDYAAMFIAQTLIVVGVLSRAMKQIMSARTVDHRADIYALRVMTYQMLTGEMPFKGGVGQVLFAHLEQPPPDLRLLRPDLSDNVAFALSRALAKNLHERYQSAGEFASALL